MITLGINGIEKIFHDASATIVRDDEVVASVEEERFNRKKHSNGMPFNSIEFCLRKANVSFDDIDHIGYYLDPLVLKKVFVDDVVSRFKCRAIRLHYVVSAAARISKVEETLRRKYRIGDRTEFHYVNHHLAHAAGAYYISGFDESAILTLDGSGERETCAVYKANRAEITKVQDILVYPESLGFIYTVISSHLGLGWVEGPGKLMGLAGYGKPDPTLFENVVILREDPSKPIEIDLSFFSYHTGGSGLSQKGLELFGEPRRRDAKLLERHFNLAASTQLMLERAVMHVVRFIPELVPGTRNLCFSGGVALNVRVNRLIIDSKLFEGFFVPPPDNDGGTSLGCALYLSATYTGNHRFRFDVYCGPDIEKDYSIDSTLEKFKKKITWRQLNEGELCEAASELIRERKIIGWARGRMECGPRALGNRSILTNAMNPRAKDELNSRVKHREWFRPYAPSVLEERSPEWFDLNGKSPYMLVEAKLLDGKETILPGITHVDQTSRIHTVTASANPTYYKLIQAIGRKTGVPVVLNTSFNRHGEPIVNTPEEAVRMLLQTEMDALFLGNYFVTKVAF
jgi:carbamoyltransferase